MNAFTELFKDNEFTGHWKSAWPKLRPAMVEMLMEAPSGTSEPVDVGRRAIFLRELIEKFDKLSELPRGGAPAPRAKKLHMQHAKPTPHA